MANKIKMLTRTFALTVISFAFGCAFSFFVPPVLRLPLVNGGELIVWPQGEFFRSFRWILFGLAVILTVVVIQRLMRSRPVPDDDGILGRWAFRVAPLGLFSVLAVVMFVADYLPSFLVANTLFFTPPLLVAWVLLRALPGANARDDHNDSRTKAAVWLFVLMAVFYAAAGYYMSTTIGEHVGDEGHYLVQAQSLFEDGDLDVRNNIGPDPIPESLRGQLHIAGNSRNGHWYSYHPFGLSLLLTAVWGGGLLVRHILLGLIAAAGCAAMYLLSRRVGVGHRASLVTVLTLGLSAYWAIFTFRSLPETLGATLLLWLFWAISRQGLLPWSTVAVAAIACVYLPFVHPRFIPLSLMGFGFYGLFGLLGAESWLRKIFRLGVFTVVCVSGYVLYQVVQNQMFDGTSYRIAETLFSYPRGVWHVIADERGLAYVLPFFFWLVPAQVVWLFRDREHRFLGIALSTMFVVCLLTSCTNTACVGGSCIPGRYLLVVVPLLIPGAAWVLERASGALRGWFFFLGSLSIWVLVLVLSLLPQIGRSFVLPLHRLTNTDVFYGFFYNLFNPHTDLFYEFVSGPAYGLYTLYVVGLLLSTLMIMTKRCFRVGWIAVIVSIGLGIVGQTIHLARQSNALSQHEVGSLLLTLGGRQVERAAFDRRPLDPPQDLFSFTTESLAGPVTDEYGLAVTTDDLGVREKNRVYSQPRMESNDWADRGYRWTTLADPFTPPSGNMLLGIHGQMEGKAEPVFCIREGGRTLYEGPLRVCDNGEVASFFTVRLKGKSGHLYLLIRIENGSGTFHLRELISTLYSEHLLRGANLRLPVGTVQAALSTSK